MSDRPQDRTEGLFDYPELERALDSHPFADIMDRYLGMDDPLSAEHLDDMAAELELSDGLRTIEAFLSEAPRYTSLYRYDIFSSGIRLDAEGQHTTPPRHAWMRVFEDLTFDDVRVERTADDVVVVIDHPSTYASSNGLSITSSEPTVLFSSYILRESPMVVGTSEDNAMGLVLLYGQTVQDVMPDAEIANQTVIDIFTDNTK